MRATQRHSAEDSSSAAASVRASRRGDLDTKVGLATDFKIGAMIGQSVQRCYGDKMNSTGGELVDGQGTGVGGLGITDQRERGFRIDGLVGFSSWVVYLDNNSDAEVGFGAGAGVGYEFAKHWVVNLDGSWGLPVESVNIFNVALTVNALSF